MYIIWYLVSYLDTLRVNQNINNLNKESKFNVFRVFNNKTIFIFIQRIHDIVAEITTMQNKTVTIHQSALATLQSAQQVMTTAEGNANQRKSEASSVVQKVGRMKVDAVTLRSIASAQQKSANDLKVRHVM